MFINLFCFIAENVHQGFCLLREFSKTCCFTKKKKVLFHNFKGREAHLLGCERSCGHGKRAQIQSCRDTGFSPGLPELGWGAGCLTSLVPTWHRSPPHSPPAIPLPHFHTHSSSVKRLPALCLGIQG